MHHHSGLGRVFPYNHRSVSAAVTQACDELKIEDLHFHDLRHEGTSRLFEAGLTMEKVDRGPLLHIDVGPIGSANLFLPLGCRYSVPNYTPIRMNCRRFVSKYSMSSSRAS